MADRTWPIQKIQRQSVCMLASLETQLVGARVGWSLVSSLFPAFHPLLECISQRPSHQATQPGLQVTAPSLAPAAGEGADWS